jgi:hypothetical protein
VSVAARVSRQGEPHFQEKRGSRESGKFDPELLSPAVRPDAINERSLRNALVEDTAALGPGTAIHSIANSLGKERGTLQPWVGIENRGNRS